MTENKMSDDYIKTLSPSVEERIAEAKERDEDEGENIVLLHGFEGAMVGTMWKDGKSIAVYEEGLCLRIIVDDLRKNCPDKPEEELYSDALDAWSYNTLRAIPYMGKNAPVIIQGFDADEADWSSLLRK